MGRANALEVVKVGDEESHDDFLRNSDRRQYALDIRRCWGANADVVSHIESSVYCPLSEFEMAS